MGYILLMTFAGSALFIGYLCWKKILGKSISQCIKYRALMMVMLIYIMPWEWLKGIYRSIIGFFRFEGVFERAKYLVDIAAIETKESAYQTKEYRLLMLATLIWFMIAIMVLVFRMAKYLRKRQAFHALAINCEDENLEHTLKCLGETIRYRHKPEIAWTRVDNETFTLGAVKPVIFLQKKYAEGDLYWILKHEMTHITRMDLLVKLLMEFICCLHWFNPLVYLLEDEMKYLCETSCDERVLEGCTDEECQIYMDLLDRNRSVNKSKNSFSSALKGDSEIDKRISLIKDRKAIRHKEKAIAICVFAFLIFLDSLTALVYPRVHHVKNAVMEAAEDSVDGGNYWVYDYAEDGYSTFEEVLLHDEQFVDEKGQIYPVEPTNEQEICSEHEIVSGVVQIHHKNSDGGCAIETYEGTRCTECGMVWKGDLLREARKIPCPH